MTPVVSSLLTAQAVCVYDKEETIWAQTEQGTVREDDGGNSQMGDSSSPLGWHFNWLQISINLPI